MGTPRVPTMEDFAGFTGAHCHQLWAKVGPNWTCPGCGRSKFQILRWVKRTPGGCEPFWGWHTGLHEHHDHEIDCDRSLTPRFQPTVMCDPCNASDGNAKRSLKLPKTFSFAPAEIRQFLTVTPHGAHKIDLTKAKQIYDATPKRVSFFL